MNEQQGPAGAGPRRAPLTVMSLMLGIAGAVVGGFVGVWVFGWMVRQGFYALLLVGALTGLGCWTLARRRSLVLGGVSGLVALGLGIYAEWHEFPFVADHSLGYFITHLHQVKPIGLLMIAGGALVALWIGRGYRSYGRLDGRS